MIQFIASIIVALVYFRAARAIGKSGIGWAFIGLIAMYLPSLVWGIVVGLMLPGLIGHVSSDAEAIFLGLMIGAVGVVLGMLTARAVYVNHLKPSPQDKHDDTVAPLPTSRLCHNKESDPRSELTMHTGQK